MIYIWRIMGCYFINTHSSFSAWTDPHIDYFPWTDLIIDCLPWTHSLSSVEWFRSVAFPGLMKSLLVISLTIFLVITQSFTVFTSLRVCECHFVIKFFLDWLIYWHSHQLSNLLLGGLCLLLSSLTQLSFSLGPAPSSICALRRADHQLFSLHWLSHSFPCNPWIISCFPWTKEIAHCLPSHY